MRFDWLILFLNRWIPIFIFINSWRFNHNKDKSTEKIEKIDTILVPYHLCIWHHEFNMVVGVLCVIRRANSWSLIGLMVLNLELVFSLMVDLGSNGNVIPIKAWIFKILMFKPWGGLLTKPVWAQSIWDQQRSGCIVCDWTHWIFIRIWGVIVLNLELEFP